MLAMRLECFFEFAPPPGEINAKAVVVSFDCKGVRLALLAGKTPVLIV
jgi:hypothetical protein